MKRLLIAFAAVVMLAVGCAAPKMTKLEAALDAVISKYDTAYWAAASDSDADSLPVLYYSNDTLNAKLKNFCKDFLINIANFDDIVFSRYHSVYDDYADNPNHYVADTSQFSGKYQIRWDILIKDAPYEKMKIKRGVVAKLLDPFGKNDFSVECAFSKNEDMYGTKKIVIFFPYLEMRLSDAEFEKL